MANGIIADPDILEEDYIPQNIPCREVQKKELSFCISQVEKGRKPLDCLCHGRPGTGKTVLVKYLLNQLEENTNALVFYVNCWENKTLNKILDQILKQAELPIAEANNSVKISGLRRKIGSKPCVVALDEVDRLETKELNDILYLLKDIGKIGIVCVSSTRKYLLNFDPRVSSRLNINSVNFPPYSDEELTMILKHRIIDCKALYPNSYSKEILEEIVDLASGDARIAIQTLRNAAFIAEKQNRNKISLEDVRKAREKVEEIKRKYTLEKLGEHHKLIYEIIKQNPGITSSELFSDYTNGCLECGLEPKSERSLNNYLEELVVLKYIKFERASVKGNIRKFFTSES